MFSSKNWHWTFLGSVYGIGAGPLFGHWNWFYAHFVCVCVRAGHF